MPKCVKCSGVFPPEFSTLLPAEKLSDEQPHMCLFCELEVKEITIEKGEGKTEKYTREQCIKDYDVFLKQIKEKKNIAQLLVKGENNVTGNIIKR
jgi:hypothetical protein